MHLKCLMCSELMTANFDAASHAPGRSNVCDCFCERDGEGLNPAAKIKSKYLKQQL